MFHLCISSNLLLWNFKVWKYSCNGTNNGCQYCNCQILSSKWKWKVRMIRALKFDFFGLKTCSRSLQRSDQTKLFCIWSCVCLDRVGNESCHPAICIFQCTDSARIRLDFSNHLCKGPPSQIWSQKYFISFKWNSQFTQISCIWLDALTAFIGLDKKFDSNLYIMAQTALSQLQIGQSEQAKLIFEKVICHISHSIFWIFIFSDSRNWSVLYG